MHWYGLVLKRDNNDVLRALDFEVVGRRGRGRLKMTWRRHGIKQVEESGLKKEDTINRPKWHNAVNKFSRITR